MRTRIISAFPGIGKSHFCRENPDIALDLDSSSFSWLPQESPDSPKTRDPDFPQNYIDAIKSNIGKYQYICVSSHEAVRAVLVRNCLFFYTFYPELDVLDHWEQYLNRFRLRGNDEAFVSMVQKNLRLWVNQVKYNNVGYRAVPVWGTRYLSDVLPQIVADEGSSDTMLSLLINTYGDTDENVKIRKNP